MGRSWSVVTPTSVEGAQLPATVRHPITHETFTLRLEGGSLLFEDGHGPPLEAVQIVGSGAHTRSFVAEADGVMRILPITEYAGKGFALSPGYEVPDHPGASRRVTDDCLNCHADQLPVVKGTRDRFASMPATAIGCSRCHGDARAHAKAQTDGQPDPGVRSPAKMPPERAADVCGACHLQGQVRVLRAGRRWDHHRPGAALSDTLAVFDRTQSGEAFNIASQAERLGRSRCAQVTGPSLNCTTCHAPHPTEAQPDRSAPCRSCHVAPERAKCTAPEGQRAEADCAQCHMPKGNTADVMHVQMTDHFIRKRPGQIPPPPKDGPLLWLNRPSDIAEDSGTAQRLLGRAYAEAHRLYGRPKDRARALAVLQKHLRPGADPDGWFDLASMARLGGDLAGARTAMTEALKRETPSADVYGAAADIALASGDATGALTHLEASLALAPHDVDRWTRKAMAQLALGQLDAAKATLDHAQTLDPRDPTPLIARGAVARLQGNLTEAIAHFEAAVALRPGHVQGWLDLCRAQLDGRAAAATRNCARGSGLGRGPGAKARFDGAFARVSLNEGNTRKAKMLALRTMVADQFNADAQMVAGVLAAEAGDVAAGRQALEKAVSIDPVMAEGWWHLSKVRAQGGDTAGATQARDRALALGYPATSEP